MTYSGAIVEIYRSKTYSPDLVTGRYIRCVGTKRKGYRFRVFETETANSGPFAGKPGMGYTLREYETDGADIPEDVKQRAIASKMTEKWS